MDDTVDQMDVFAMPDNSTGAGSSWGGWAQGALSYSLKRYIDSEFAQPWMANDPALFYGAGGTRTAAGTPAAAAPASAINPLWVLSGLALFGVALYVALK